MGAEQQGRLAATRASVGDEPVRVDAGVACRMRSAFTKYSSGTSRNVFGSPGSPKYASDKVG